MGRTFNVGLKSLLHQGLSEPEFYSDLVYKFKKNMGRTDFASYFAFIGESVVYLGAFSVL